MEVIVIVINYNQLYYSIRREGIIKYILNTLNTALALLDSLYFNDISKVLN